MTMYNESSFSIKEDIKGNNTWISIGSKVVRIDNIEEVLYDCDTDNNCYISVELKDGICISKNLAIKHLDINISNIILSDIMNNNWDDFTTSNLIYIFYRKALIYITTKMCENYACNLSDWYSLNFMDVDHDELVDQCSIIKSRINFEYDGKDYYADSKNVDQFKIKFLKDDKHNNKKEFKKLYEDWKVLLEVIDEDDIL